ncbi:hypothetical protein R0131_10575 [Clostridium sp. AL.422]|uniref:hypothetical protein n=1 Tax=Clostridium TaxID=1485 RepID=UPI00293DB3DE|nr:MULTISPECIES: hypothetical protein [unclassified Clostridium]MDV4151286.1 hypothetical protein [Clostridium sp. AL.422]
MKKLITYSNIVFIISVGIFIYGAYKIFTVRQLLPAGVCPIDNNRPILFIGIFFMVLSIIISYIEDKIAKKKILE